MRRLLPILLLTVAVLLVGCVTSGPNNLSTYYKNTSVSAELYNGGKIIDLNAFEIDKPRDKIVILFNHGTRSWREVQACRPINFGNVINTLDGRKINNKRVMAFHLCSFSTGNYAGQLTRIRATEIQLAVSYFVKLGVKAGNIFVFGQSRGGWSALYFAANNKKQKLGGYIVFAPAICGPRPLSCWDVIDEHITLFKSARIDGILYSHPLDPFFSPKEHKFANEVQGLKLRTGFCRSLTGRRAHGFYKEICSGELSEEVKEYIFKRTSPE
jgi:pimeloyl-ACP methyl ester carboxylesterase